MELDLELRFSDFIFAPLHVDIILWTGFDWYGANTYCTNNFFIFPLLHLKTRHIAGIFLYYLSLLPENSGCFTGKFLKDFNKIKIIMKAAGFANLINRHIGFQHQLLRPAYS